MSMTRISDHRAAAGADTARAVAAIPASEQRVTGGLVAQALAHRYEALPADVIELARLCILDYVAVGLASRWRASRATFGRTRCRRVRRRGRPDGGTKVDVWNHAPAAERRKGRAKRSFCCAPCRAGL